MSAVIQILITADEDHLSEAIGEVMIMLNARWWDDTDDICLRVADHLRHEEAGRAGD